MLRNKERTVYHRSHPLPFLFHLPQWSFLIVVQLRRRAKRLSDGFVHVKRASSVASRGLVYTLPATLGVGRNVHCQSKDRVIPITPKVGSLVSRRDARQADARIGLPRCISYEAVLCSAPSFRCATGVT
jgi:hypothetical protein